MKNKCFRCGETLDNKYFSTIETSMCLNCEEELREALEEMNLLSEIIDSDLDNQEK